MQTLPLYQIVRGQAGAQVGALATAAAAAKPGNRLELSELPAAPQPSRPRNG